MASSDGCAEGSTLSTHLKKFSSVTTPEGIEEVQHVARVLDAVLGCLLWSGG